MTLIKRDQVAQPMLGQEVVSVEPLGGDVIVRELKLSERLYLREAKLSKTTAPVQADSGDATAEDDTQAAPAPINAARQTGSDDMLLLLSLAVVDADDQPVFTPEQWDAFGGKHGAVVNALFGKALTLSGYDDEANRKN